MQILNSAVTDDLRAMRPLKLNLGSGARAIPGHYGVDCVTLPGVDILADLNEPFSELPDNCVESIYCRHTVEHVNNFLPLLAEIHRICIPDAKIEIIVPHFSNPYGYSDPTHVRFFGLYSFFYFCEEADQPRRKVPNFYSPVRFRVETVRFNLLKESVVEKLFRWLAQPLVNLRVGFMDWYERRLSRLFPINDIRYVLRPVKVAAAAEVRRSKAA